MRLWLFVILCALIFPCVAEAQISVTGTTKLIVGGAVVSSSNPLPINCGGSPCNGTDGGSFTFGTSAFASIGGPYQTNPLLNPLTTGQQGGVQLTQYRALFSSPYDTSGTTLSDPVNHALRDEILQGGSVLSSSNPLPFNTAQWASTTLGAPSNYGTSPGAVAVPGVNAFITNSLTIQPGNTPNTSPWLMTVNQGGNSAVVAAASTAATAGNPSLVVGLSPNSPLPTGTNTIGNETNGADTTATGSLSATGTVSVATNGAATVMISAVLSGTTPTDTFSLQGQMPDTSWQTINAYPIPALSSGAPATQPIAQSTGSLTGEWVVPAAGFSHVRLNLTAISGTGAALAINLEASRAQTFPSVDTIVTGVGSVAAPVAMQTCQQYAFFDATAALSGANTLVAAASGHIIHVCGYSVMAGGTATNVGLDSAPATCGTSDVKMTPYWPLIANSGKVVSSAFWEGMATPSGSALCLNASAANSVQAEVWYSVY